MPYVPNLPRTPATVLSNPIGAEQLPAEFVKIQFDDTIAQYEPNAAPYLTISAKLNKKEMVRHYQYFWGEEDFFPFQVNANGAVLVGDTSILLQAGQGSRIQPHTTLLTATGEIMLVTSVTVDTMVVIRGVGGTTAAAYSAGAAFNVLSTAFEDGFGPAQPKAVNPVVVFNYAQIVKNDYALTGRMLETEVFGGERRQRFNRKSLAEHLKSIERAIMFGARAIFTAGLAHPRTLTGGFNFYAKNNVWDVNTLPLTEANWLSWLKAVMREGEGGYIHGSANKTIFCGMDLLVAVSTFSLNRVQVIDQDESLGGIAITKYHANSGTVNLVHDPIFDQSGFANRAFLLDLNHASPVWFEGRQTRLIRKPADEGLIDSEQYEWRSDVGFKLQLPDAHGSIINIPAQ